MFNVKSIENLARVEGRGLVSLYIDVDRKKYSDVAIVAKLKDLFKKINIKEKDKIDLQQKTVDLYKRSASHTKALAIFYSPSHWYAYVFPHEIEDSVTVDNFFNIEPVLDLLHQSRTVGVLLFDSEQARFLCVFLGHLETHQHIEDRMIRRHSKGGWSKPRFERKINGEIKSHLKHTVDFLNRMDKVYELDLLYIRSEASLEDELVKLMPESLKNKIKGWITLDMGVEPDKVVKLVNVLVEEEVKKEEESEMSEIEQMIKNDIHGSYTTHGFQNVSKALYDQKVAKIFVNKEYIESGFYCQFCGYLSTSEEFCPYDQTVNNRTTNVISVLLDEAIKKKIKVNVYENDSVVKKYGNIIALLSNERSII
jgi:peptide subunit release factor 1 (eRF1)